MGSSCVRVARRRRRRPASASACVRSCGSTTPVVRLDAERRHDPVAPACDTVGADVVLLEEPDCGRRVPDRRPVDEPALEALRRGALVRLDGQVDDVVRVACPERVACLGVDHVVRRGRHVRARPCVADGAKRADVGHRSSLQRP